MQFFLWDIYNIDYWRFLITNFFPLDTNIFAFKIFVEKSFGYSITHCPCSISSLYVCLNLNDKIISIFKVLNNFIFN